MPPLTPYLITGTVKDSEHTILTSLNVTLKNVTKGSNPLVVTTDSNGKYTADAANFNTGYSDGDEVSVSATNPFGDETKTETFTISGDSKVQDLNLQVIESLPDETQGHHTKIIPVNLSGKPFQRNNPFPVENQDVLAKYQPADEDISGDPEYYGFTDKDGNWYIQQISPSNGTYRYAKGSTNYITNWTNRTSLSYDYFHNVF
jgi:hypothetical protein